MVHDDPDRLYEQEADEVLDVVDQTILEVLTPNQAQDKATILQIKEDQRVIMAGIEEMKNELKQIKTHLAIVTDTNTEDSIL